MSVSTDLGRAFVSGLRGWPTAAVIGPEQRAAIGGVYPFDFTGVVPPTPPVTATQAGGGSKRSRRERREARWATDREIDRRRARYDAPSRIADAHRPAAPPELAADRLAALAPADDRVAPPLPVAVVDLAAVAAVVGPAEWSAAARAPAQDEVIAMLLADL